MFVVVPLAETKTRLESATKRVGFRLQADVTFQFLPWPHFLLWHFTLTPYFISSRLTTPVAE